VCGQCEGFEEEISHAAAQRRDEINYLRCVVASPREKLAESFAI